MRDLGAKLKKIRDEQGFPQKVIAEHLGLHRTNYSRIENNLQKLTPEQIVLFCEFCDVSADYLLGVTAKNKVVQDTQTMKDVERKLQEIQELLRLK